MMSSLSAHTLLISAPSGTGKTTLIQALGQRQKLRFSISHTTRKPRSGERDGVDYHFVTIEEFQQLQLNGIFLEVAQIHGNWYGTGWKNLTTSTDPEAWLVLDLDSQGFSSVKKKFPDIVSVFVLPPKLEDLNDRILKRQPDINLKELQTRLKAAQNEISKAYDYDYVVVNQRVETAADELSFILRCETLRSAKRHALIRSLCC